MFSICITSCLVFVREIIKVRLSSLFNAFFINREMDALKVTIIKLLILLLILPQYISDFFIAVCI